MQNGLKNAVLGNARVMQQQFLNDFTMVMARNTYRAPGRYHMTDEQFAKEVEKTDLNLKHNVMIAFMCQAFVEQSRWRTRRMNRIIRWVEKVSQLQEAAAQTKLKRNAAEVPPVADNIVDFRSTGAQQAPVPEMLATGTLNRKQRRRMERLGFLKRKEEKEPFASGATPPPAPGDGSEDTPRAD